MNHQFNFNGTCKGDPYSSQTDRETRKEGATSVFVSQFQSRPISKYIIIKCPNESDKQFRK